MKNYKWDVRKGISTSLSRLYMNKAMSADVRSNIWSPEKCYEWLKKEEELNLDITEINQHSSPTYGNRIGRYYFVEKGADILASIMFMEYALKEIDFSGSDKPEFLLLDSFTIDESGISYTTLSDSDTEKWCDEMCEEFVSFVSKLDNKRQERLESIVHPSVICNKRYAAPLGNVLKLDIDNSMTYGEFKKQMIDVFHVRPWHIKHGWTRKSQEEKNSKLLSEMRLSSGRLTLGEDATIDDLSHMFYDECHGYMKWRYVKRQWLKIPREVRLCDVEKVPSFWESVLSYFLDY